MVEGGGLALRAGGVIAMTVAGAVALALLLAFLKFDQKLLDVTASRLAVVAEEVGRQAELGMTLGLDLRELEDLRGVAERAAVIGKVTRIAVVDGDGTTLYASSPDVVGRRIERPADANPSADGRFRRWVDGDSMILSLPLRNAFAQQVGEVVVSAGLGELRSGEAAVRGELIHSAVPVIAVALLVTGVAVKFTVSWSTRAERALSEGASFGAVAPEGRPRGGETDDEGDLAETTDHLHLTLEPRLAAAIAAADRAMGEVSRALPPPTSWPAHPSGHAVDGAVGHAEEGIGDAGRANGTPGKETRTSDAASNREEPR